MITHTIHVSLFPSLTRRVRLWEVPDASGIHTPASTIAQSPVSQRSHLTLTRPQSMHEFPDGDDGDDSYSDEDQFIRAGISRDDHLKHAIFHPYQPETYLPGPLYRVISFFHPANILSRITNFQLKVHTTLYFNDRGLIVSFMSCL